jgi:hypothetical protein
VRTVVSSISPILAFVLQFSVEAIVKLTLLDTALFGHVAQCTPHDDKYRVGIEVVRVLIGESDMARLVNSVTVSGR